MSLHQFFNKQSSLRSWTKSIAFLFGALLIYGCGGDEPITNPISGSAGSEKPAPISTPYFPMTLGSRWVYRNPDGSEWTREVIETTNYGGNLYHFFSSDPPLQDTQVEALRSPVYVAFLERLDRRIVRNDLSTAIWEIIVHSGGDTPSWSLGMGCNKRGRQKAVCVSTKDRSPPGILTYLYRYNASVASNSRLTQFQFPLVPGETYDVLSLILRGSYDRPHYIHDFEAEVVILGRIGDDRELVEVSAGDFEDCFKIQYEARLASFRTVKFRIVAGLIFARDVYRETVESEIREELTDLSMLLASKIGLQTMWLAPGVGPVKLETSNDMAELIDYEIK